LAGALPQTPLGELTALPRHLDLRGLLLRGGREKEEMKGKEGVEGRKGKGGETPLKSEGKG